VRVGRPSRSAVTGPAAGHPLRSCPSRRPQLVKRGVRPIPEALPAFPWTVRLRAGEVDRQAISSDERISVLQAVDAYTRGSAYAAFADDRVGSLAVGKLADFAVLSQDIFSVAPESIGKTQVVMTVVGGRIVYGAAPRD